LLSHSVPITSVTLTEPTSGNIQVIARRNITLRCVTSGGLPAASIRWNKDTGNPDITDATLLTGATSVITTVNGLHVTTSTLVNTPTVHDDSMRIYCVANNTDDVFTSNQFVLDVQRRYYRLIDICTEKESLLNIVCTYKR